VNRWIVLTSFRPTAEPAEVQSWLAAANVVAVDAPDIIDSSVAENLPGSVSDCDAVWDLLTLEDSPRQILSVRRLIGAGCVASTEVLGLDTITSRYEALSGPRIKRTLALTVRTSAPASEMQRFERSLAAMSAHIVQIRSCALSRVRPLTSGVLWTHVWEQEYADVAGLRTGYMANPYHWTGVDRWFDPEVPCSIVEPRLAHTFRWADRPILGRLAGSRKSDGGGGGI
jgi:Stress responsive A/B Barrel Domain